MNALGCDLLSHCWPVTAGANALFVKGWLLREIMQCQPFLCPEVEMVSHLGADFCIDGKNHLSDSLSGEGGKWGIFPVVWPRLPPPHPSVCRAPEQWSQERTRSNLQRSPSGREVTTTTLSSQSGRVEAISLDYGSVHRKGHQWPRRNLPRGKSPGLVP